MKRFVVMLSSGVLAMAGFCCEAEATCAQVAVQATAEAGPGGLTLADLLTQDSCPQLLKAAARVSLGGAPLAGSVRVIAGSQIRRQLEALVDEDSSLHRMGGIQIPERIIVKRAGGTKSCAEIARFLAGAGRRREAAKNPEPGDGKLNCAAAHGVPDDARLELVKTSSNRAMRRQEFCLRCSRPDDCVAFLVWISEEMIPATSVSETQTVAARRFRAVAEATSVSGSDGMVRPGQTATLTWDQAGIRIVLPVICLEAGALGQFVRVRFKNATHVLRAEVVGKAMLRANL